MLQSVAWLSMIVRYAQDYPLREAITMTFDGQHPCAICVFVAEGMRQEAQQDQPHLLPLPRLESVPCELGPALFPPAVMDLCESSQTLPAGRSDAPPAPPPRFA
jgi:hypothetical protein